MEKLESLTPRIRLDGCTLIKREQYSGGVRERFTIAPGEYAAYFGFRNFGENEDDWFLGASDIKEHRDSAFILNYSEPIVKDFIKNLLHEEYDFDNIERFRNLVSRFNKMIPSADICEEENHRSIADVIRTGRGTCAAKSVLLGSILAKETSLSVQDIIGQYGVVKEKVSYPWSHEWIRAEGQKYIFLCDPMYNNLAIFEKDAGKINIVDNGDKSFSKYTPQFLPAAKFLNTLKIDRSTGLNVVDSYNNDEHEVYIPQDYSLSSQVNNNSSFSFAINEGDTSVEFSLDNNSLISQRTDKAKMYFPLKAIERLE